ncbi:MAG: flagellar export chaperone FlgN [Gemmatimonadaceae bacterium]
MTSGPVHPSPAMAQISPAQWIPLVRGLADALQSERRLIDDLITIMRTQREAVAADDLQGVDDSVFSVQRVLHTLAEARKRRRALNVRLGHSEDVALRDLLESMGPYANDDLRSSRDALQVSARSLTRDVTTNRQILREALTTGEEMVRTLAGVAAPRVGYGEHGASGDALSGSFLVNRQA